MNMKELLKRWEKQSDKDFIKYSEIFPLAAQYHRGYRDAITDLLQEMDNLDVRFSDHPG